jgi:hypothetical protein
MSKDKDAHDGFSEVVCTTQEEEHTLQKRPTEQFLEDCSKILDANSERLTADRKSSGTEKNRNSAHHFVNCNKSPLSNNRILPAEKGTPPQNCDKGTILANGEVLQAVDRACTPRRETAPESCNNKSRTPREKELSPAIIKSTRKQTMENYEKRPTAASVTDTGEQKERHSSGYETLVCSSAGAPTLQEEISEENVYRKESHRKGTLIQHYTKTHRKQKLFCDIGKNKQNSGTKEKPRDTFFKKCDTGNETTRTRLLFSDSETSISEDTRNAEEYTKSPVSSKEKLVASVDNTSVPGAKTYLENVYPRPFGRTEDVPLPRPEVNLGSSGGGYNLRKNKLPTIDKQILPTLQDKLLTEAEESVDCVRAQAVQSGEKTENTAVGCSVAEEEEIVAVTGQECRIRNPVSIRKQLCGQNATSQPVESCTKIDRWECLSSEFVCLPMSDEDYVGDSMENASTVIIHPLLSCKYEHAVSEIRNKLKIPREILKHEDRGLMEIRDESKQTVSSQVYCHLRCDDMSSSTSSLFQRAVLSPSLG